MRHVTSVQQLICRIHAYIRHLNVHSKPFVWVATAESIEAKLEDYNNVIPKYHISLQPLIMDEPGLMVHVRRPRNLFHDESSGRFA